MTAIRDRIGTLEVGLDDLQSGIEAGTRTATALQKEAATLDDLVGNQLKMAEAVGAVVRRSAELRACLRDQREALRELRENMVLLRAELHLARQR